MQAAFATDAGMLHAAERGSQVAQEPGVDPADTDIEACAHAVRARQIGGKHRRREAVGSIVGKADRLLLGNERCYVAARPEYLLAHDAARFRKAGPDGRLNPGAVGEIGRHPGYTAADNDV